MSFENISFIILILSFFGLVVFIYRKIPVLASLPLSESVPVVGVFSRISGLLKKMPWFKNFSKEIFLHKIVSKMRIVTLRADHKTFNWLKSLREKNQKDKLENENYWEEIKNSKDLKK
jgi:hypothetical protein